MGFFALEAVLFAVRNVSKPCSTVPHAAESFK